MDIETQLRQLGLHHSEITVYLFLLKNGVSTPPTVSHGTSIARTNCYNILVELENKGLIAERTEAKRKVYEANNPQSLISLLESKVADAEEILPELQAIYTHQESRKEVIFYEGTEQVKAVFEQSLSAKTILSIGSRKRLQALLPDFEKHYFQEVRKREVVFYDLTDRESKIMTAKVREFLKGYYAVRQLPPEYQETAMDILVWNDTVAFLNLKDTVFAMVVKNQALTDMLEMLFKIIWKKI